MNDDRLESWKDIAAHFGRDIRTVQRWEKIEGLPVHRHAHRRRSTPFAYVHELEEWFRNRDPAVRGIMQLPTRALTLENEPHSHQSSGPASIPPAGPLLTPPISNRARKWFANGIPHRPVAALAALLLFGVLAFGDRPTKPPASDPLSWLPPLTESPNWILVAEFQGPDDEPKLAQVVRELTISALAQSHLVTPISRTELAEGLKTAMLPDTTRVVGEVARQLAFRATARTCVEGQVDRVGNGFSVILRVIDSESGVLRFSVSGIAAERDRLIPMLDDLGRQLRRELGENQGLIRATRPFNQVITPCFEAYRLFLESVDVNVRTGNRFRSRQLAEEALAIDPDFAMAWFQVAAMTCEIPSVGWRAWRASSRK